MKKAGKVKEWIEMEGDEFYRFLRTEDAKGRYFIQLANDGDPDCDVIHMEVSKPEYLAWRADFDRKQYYRKRNLRHGFVLSNNIFASTYTYVIPEKEKLIAQVEAVLERWEDKKD